MTISRKDGSWVDEKNLLLSKTTYNYNNYSNLFLNYFERKIKKNQMLKIATPKACIWSRLLITTSLSNYDGKQRCKDFLWNQILGRVNAKGLSACTDALKFSPCKDICM